jgi:benzodiazapine receptor
MRARAGFNAGARQRIGLSGIDCMNMLASRGQLRASFIRWALFTVPLIVLLGFLSGQSAGADSAWFAGLDKPAIYPPPAAFGIVWTILYVIIGLAVAVVCAAWGARGRTLALVAFAIHFVFNLAWTPVFFGMQQIAGGLVVIALMALTLLAVVVLFWRVRRIAGLLMLPYLAWVLFALALNFQFLQLNPDADGGTGGGTGDGAIERVRIGA